VAIEALMAGCPLVTFPVGAVDQVVEHGVTGLVTDRHDPVEMAEAVASLLADDARRTGMSDQARLRTKSFAASSAATVYAARLSAALAAR
jgi:glycosyltransferase involved in cell wall biosynthesis